MAEIAGLKLITPSSVAGSGVSLSGAKVVFTAATSVSVNGVFSATYDNYLVVYRSIASAQNHEHLLRLRASGSDATGSNYAFQQMAGQNTNVSAARQTSQSTLNINISGNTKDGGHIYFYGPALAQPTAIRAVNASSRDGALFIDYACTHSLTTSYDGFTMYLSTQTFTGSMTVYGLSQ